MLDVIRQPGEADAMPADAMPADATSAESGKKLTRRGLLVAAVGATVVATTGCNIPEGIPLVGDKMHPEFTTDQSERMRGTGGELIDFLKTEGAEPLGVDKWGIKNNPDGVEGIVTISPRDGTLTIQVKKLGYPGGGHYEDKGEFVEDSGTNVELVFRVEEGSPLTTISHGTVDIDAVRGALESDETEPVMVGVTYRDPMGNIVKASADSRKPRGLTLLVGDNRSSSVRSDRRELDGDLVTVVSHFTAATNEVLGKS